MEEVRKHFKMLKDNTIYFDNSASTLKPDCVVDAVNDYNQNISTNSGRSVYKLGYKATKMVEETRQRVAEFLNCEDKDQIVFTKNTTEAINLVANGFVRYNLKKDDEIIVSELEHNSNFLPFFELSKQIGVKLVFVELSKDHKITVENFEKALSDKTKFVALTYVSNVLGYTSPVEQIVELAHQKGAKVLIDGAQAVSHFKIDLKKLDCDFFAFSGYKIFGPSGIGVLFGKSQLLENMHPTNFGGGMVLDVSKNHVEYKSAPERFEGGTLPIGSIIGLKSAIDFVESVGRFTIENQEKELTKYFYENLKKIDGVEVYGQMPDVPIFLFNIKGLHAHDVASMYDEMNICVRAGHHCAQLLMKHIGQIATVRASLCFYNTKKEIDQFLTATKKIVEFVKSFNRR